MRRAGIVGRRRKPPLAALTSSARATDRPASLTITPFPLLPQTSPRTNMPPKQQKKRVSFSSGVEVPDDLLHAPAVFRHPDPLLRRHVPGPTLPARSPSCPSLAGRLTCAGDGAGGSFTLSKHGSS